MHGIDSSEPRGQLLALPTARLHPRSLVPRRGALKKPTPFDAPHAHAEALADAPAEGSTDECLSEDEALRYVEGEATASAETIQNHLDVCPICRVLVGEAVLAMGHADESPDTSPASRRRTLTAGTVVSRRYEVVQFLARGGMGEVYEARDTVLGEVVALKTLVATALDDSYAMSRLREEVRIARQVTHPNVCRILEFGFHQSSDGAAGEPVPFLTMEFCAVKPSSNDSRAKVPSRPSKLPVCSSR